MLQEQYPLLSDQDMHYETGRVAEMLARIEARLNATREEVINIFQENLLVITMN
jgi:hypothetical protein